MGIWEYGVWEYVVWEYGSMKLHYMYAPLCLKFRHLYSCT